MAKNTVAFTSNFAYSSNGYQYFDLKDIPLVVFEDVEETESTYLSVPNSQLLKDNMESFSNLRKRSKAQYIKKFESALNLNLGDGTTSGFYNITTFRANGGENARFAFNTLIGSDVWSYATLASTFQERAFPEALPVLTGNPQKMIVTANNCLYAPELAGLIGVPILFASDSTSTTNNKTRLLKYPRTNNSSNTQNIANFFPVDVAATTNKHISMVSCEDSYYFTRYSTVSSTLEIKKLPYKNISSSVPLNTVFTNSHYSGQNASSTMWVDLDNDLLISHGDTVFVVFAQLPTKKNWTTLSFLPSNVDSYQVQSPYIIERAILDPKTNRHFALCCKNTTGFTVTNTAYLCELVFDTSNNTIIVTELNPNPVNIIDTDNKEINIPTGGDYIIISSVDSSKNCFDIATNKWKPITYFVEFPFEDIPPGSQLQIISVTQPIRNSTSNYVTCLKGAEITAWKIIPLASNN
jgi:hypothetical protein